MFTPEYMTPEERTEFIAVAARVEELYQLGNASKLQYPVVDYQRVAGEWMCSIQWDHAIVNVYSDGLYSLWLEHPTPGLPPINCDFAETPEHAISFVRTVH